jgi:hypothetical protein
MHLSGKYLHILFSYCRRYIDSNGIAQIEDVYLQAQGVPPVQDTLLSPPGVYSLLGTNGGLQYVCDLVANF